MSEATWPTIMEASKQISVSDSYLRRLLNNGRLQGILRGNTWFIDPESLRHYEETRDRKRGPKGKRKNT